MKIRALFAGFALGALCGSAQAEVHFCPYNTACTINTVFYEDAAPEDIQDAPTFAVVRRKDRKRFPDQAGSRKVSFYFESLDFPARERKLNAYLADFQPSAVDDIRLHRHPGVEFIYVIEGRLGLYIRDKETTLELGDSVYFDSGQQHGYRRVGRKVCRGLVVTVPATSQR